MQLPNRIGDVKYRVDLASWEFDARIGQIAPEHFPDGAAESDSREPPCIVEMFRRMLQVHEPFLIPNVRVYCKKR